MKRVQYKLADAIGSGTADPSTAPARQLPVPQTSVENKPAPGQKGPAGMAGRTTYSRVNTGLPPIPDAGAMAQKNQPPRGMEFLPKLASSENHMTTSMARPPLQDLIKTAMEGSASKLDISLEAARQITNAGGTPPTQTKTASANTESDVEHVPTELISKLAAAAQYTARQLNPKLADIQLSGGTTNGVGPGEGPGAIQVMQAKADGSGVIEANNTGKATPGNQPPMAPALVKDPTRPTAPANSLETNDAMQHPEQPEEPVSNEKASVKAAQAMYINNLIATGLFKTAATSNGLELVPANEAVKLAFGPEMMAAGALGGAGYGALNAPEGRGVEGALRGAAGSVTAPIGAAGGAALGAARGVGSGMATGAKRGALLGGLGGGTLGALAGAGIGHLTGLGAGKGALVGGGLGAVSGGLGGAGMGAGIGGAAGGVMGAGRGFAQGGQAGWDLAQGNLKAASVSRKQVKTAAARMVALVKQADVEDVATPPQWRRMGIGAGGALGALGGGLSGAAAGYPLLGAAAGGLAGAGLTGALVGGTEGAQLGKEDPYGSAAGGALQGAARGLGGSVVGGGMGGLAGGIGGAGIGAGLGAGLGGLAGGAVGGIKSRSLSGAARGAKGGAAIGAGLGAGAGGVMGALHGGTEGAGQGYDMAMSGARENTEINKKILEQVMAEQEAQAAQSGDKQASAKIAYARNLMAVGLYKKAEDAIFPAQLSAGKADATGATPPTGAAPSGEHVPTEPSDVNSQKTKMLSSNDAAINYTKRDAKGDPKGDLGDVLQEPAQTSATDKTLDQILQNTDAAGAKISMDLTRIAGARAVLAKLAAATMPPAGVKPPKKTKQAGALDVVGSALGSIKMGPRDSNSGLSGRSSFRPNINKL